MTKRLVYFPSSAKDKFVETKEIEFTWFPGFAVSQKQKSIHSLHEGIKRETNCSNILEISSKSPIPLGIQSSAFNLKINIDDINTTVESFFQGSKVFEGGGPFTDLYFKESIQAKKDTRLNENGELKYFEYKGETWKLEENFYSWVYLLGLYQNENISREIIKYDAFTDIEFNPKKSHNCQANSAAIYTSAVRKKINLDEINSSVIFKKIFFKEDIGPRQIKLL